VATGPAGEGECGTGRTQHREQRDQAKSELNGATDHCFAPVFGSATTSKHNRWFRASRNSVPALVADVLEYGIGIARLNCPIKGFA
jgi:hypothetical protein